MKNILIAAILFLIPVMANADQWVNGYTRSNGTYVQGYMRSSPNSLKYDNYSSKGNVNPYNGKIGTQRNEFSNPPSYNKSYGGGIGGVRNSLGGRGSLYNGY